MTGSDYFDFVVQAETDLQRTFTRTASQFNNAGGSVYAGVTFSLAELPMKQVSFAQTGEITLSISMPSDTNYYGVTFSDVRAFLVGLPVAGRTPVTIDLVKAGTSLFKDHVATSTASHTTRATRRCDLCTTETGVPPCPPQTVVCRAGTWPTSTLGTPRMGPGSCR